MRKIKGARGIAASFTEIRNWRFDCILSAGERVQNCRMDPQISKVFERWVIKPQDLELGEVLGRGGFGVVSAGTWRDEESKVQVRDL